MDINIMLGQMAQFFMVMCLGYILYKVKFIDDDFIKKFTTIVLQVAMPALILAAVLRQIENRNMKEAAFVFGIATAMYVILPIVGWIVAKLLGTPLNQMGLYIFMMVYSNVGFMGIPLINALYGEKAVFLTAIFNLLFNLSSFSFGVIVMNYGLNNKAKFNPKSLIKPGIIVPCLALIIYCIGIEIPTIVVNGIASVGNMTTPAAMLLIGAALAKIEISKVFNDVRVYIFSIIKQLIVPILAWIVLKNIISSEEIMLITIIMISMPIANSAVLFATEYESDEELAAKSVFITTVMSLITIPIVSIICLR